MRNANPKSQSSMSGLPALEEEMHKRPPILLADAVLIDSVTNPTAGGGLRHLLNTNSSSPPEVSGATLINFGSLLRGPDQAFPDAFFLDSDLFTPLGEKALSRSSQSQAHQLALEQLIQDPMSICATYFSTVDKWLPVVSRKRLIYELGAESADDACLMLLIACMKLCTTTEGQTSESLYATARSLCSAAEMGGYSSLRLLQSLVLLGVYELSHAIYPAAFLTISRAARLGILMGLHDRKNAPQIFKSAETWTLQRTAKDVVGGLYARQVRQPLTSLYTDMIANADDRVVNMETCGIPFAAAEPCQSELLPINDDDWENGRVVPSEPLYTRSFSSVTTLGSFAKTCQAAHMLSKVMRHREARKSSQDITELLPEAQRLHQALHALHLSMEGSDSVSQASQIPALALCFSARLILYNEYACNEPLGLTTNGPVALETEMQKASLEGIRAITSITAHAIAQDSSGCPFVARFLYHAATECAWFIKEDHEQVMYDALEEIVGGLRRIGERWAVAGQYISLLDQGEVLTLVPAGGDGSSTTSTF
ncbi:hypothetical protein ACJZ2D_002182 [Fusarium nematophilum]